MRSYDNMADPDGLKSGWREKLSKSLAAVSAPTRAHTPTGTAVRASAGDNKFCTYMDGGEAAVVRGLTPKV